MGILFEILVEMGRVLKTQRVGDLRSVPVGVQQQRFGLFYNAFVDDLAGGFARRFFKHIVQMVDVNIQLVGIGGGRE
ncbi:hypothetical protein D3C87_1818540 [compost metagenome]